MSRGVQAFKQGDLTRAIKALMRAGAQGHVDITRDGKIRVTVVGAEINRAETKQTADEWD
jgi:hypothetical protein